MALWTTKKCHNIVNGIANDNQLARKPDSLLVSSDANFRTKDGNAVKLV